MIQTQLGKLAGSVTSPLMEVMAWDDGAAPISEDAAVGAALAAAPTEVFGLGKTYGEHSVEQLANWAWKIGVQYKDYKPSAFTPPAPAETIQIDYRFNSQAKPKFAYNALECLGAYLLHPDGSGITYDSPDLHRTLVNVQKVGGVNRAVGLEVQPLEEVHTLDLIIPNAEIDASYRETLASLLGRFNDGAFMGYAAGEVQLVRVSGGRRTDSDWQLSLGFGSAPTATNVEFDAYDQTLQEYGVIVVPAIQATSVTWGVMRDVLAAATNTTEQLATCVYLQRVWEFGDFDELGLGL